jgi:hypothetical protein
MKRALFVLLAIAVAGLNGGCQLCHRMQHGKACHDGCSHGCPDGACAHGGQGQCADGTDGHSDPYEPLYSGYQQCPAPQRGGVLSWLGRFQGAPPAAAQPAPGPSAGNVSYPYYTNRGPRDFLANDPRGIGP